MTKEEKKKIMDRVDVKRNDDGDIMIVMKYKSRLYDEYIEAFIDGIDKSVDYSIWNIEDKNRNYVDIDMDDLELLKKAVEIVKGEL